MLIDHRRELRSTESYHSDELRRLKNENVILEGKLTDVEQKLLRKQHQRQRKAKEQEERCTNLEKQLEECEMKLVKKQEELEEAKRISSAESASIIESLTISRDMLRKELRLVWFFRMKLFG